MIEGLADKFRFITIPTAVPVEGGMKFERGLFGDTNITLLEVFSDGLFVSVPSNTDDASVVLEECLKFFFEIGVRRPISPPVTYPVSRLIVDFEHSIDGLIRLTALFEGISRRLLISGRAQLFSVVFSVDPTTLPKRLAVGNPTLFRLERRADTPYDQNRYFSLAYLRTADHKSVLEEIEQSLQAI
jgi:hypothetical protein